MSALAWLFGLGILTAAFPILFHLIRRTPKGQVAFSSLMFLSPSPPRLTKRSRLENLLLLALRVAAIALIAAAFMRPFFRSNVSTSLADLPGQKLSVLLDTSASMKRGDLWDQALDRVKQVVDRAGEKDEVAIYTFDSQLTLRKQLGPKLGGDFVTANQLVDVEPSWNPSDLGAALVQLADSLDQQEDQTETKSNLQIVVVSDMQAGSATSALQNYQWPAKVKVDFEKVTLKASNNASLQLLPADESSPNSARENVLVRNAKNSAIEQFKVSWATNGSESAEQAVPFYVPPGSSMILKVERSANALQADKLILEGDSDSFDNQFYVVPQNQQNISVAYLGNESRGDPDRMLYYFASALMETPVRVVNISQFTSDSVSRLPAENEQENGDPGRPTNSTSTTLTDAIQGGLTPELVVVNRSVSDEEKKAIDRLLETGVTLLVVASNEEMLSSTQSWTLIDEQAKLTEDLEDEYAMLGQIEFSDPIFEPFAGPRFNDFTQIRFWNHLKATLPKSTEVIARFDNNWPAIWHQSINPRSSIYTFASGWQPNQSQLALSSKFLPITNRIVELASRTPQIESSSTIGQPIDLPEGYDQVASISDNSTTQKIDFESLPYSQIDSPGVYRFTNSNDASAPEIRIAMNVDPHESNTELMPLEQLTAFDVQVGTHADAEDELEQQRAMLDMELESQQKLWKWLIMAAIGFIIIESWLAGRTDRANSHNEKLAMEDVA